MDFQVTLICIPDLKINFKDHIWPSSLRLVHLFLSYLAGLLHEYVISPYVLLRIFVLQYVLLIIKYYTATSRAIKEHLKPRVSSCTWSRQVRVPLLDLIQKPILSIR